MDAVASVETILGAFADEGSRYAMPFYCHGYLCATDGFMVVRTKLPANVKILPSGLDVTVADWSGIDMPQIEWPALPDSPTIRTGKCDECSGTGRDECPHCGREDDCEACNGTGTRTVIAPRELQSVEIFGEHFDAMRLLVIHATGATLREPKEKSIAFAGNGFDGLLMSLRESCKRDVSPRLVAAIAALARVDGEGE